MSIVYRVCLNSLAISFVLLILMASASTSAENTQQSNYLRSSHNYKIPNVMVVRHDGRKTQLSSVLGHSGPVIVNFIFTTCNTICPIMTAIVSKVHATIGPTSPNLLFVSISIDPEHDTPTTLSEYAERYKAGSNWQFLTGGLTEVQVIQRAFDAYSGDKMNHTSLTLMRGSNSSSWIRIEGFANANELIREYKLLTNK